MALASMPFAVYGSSEGLVSRVRNPRGLDGARIASPSGSTTHYHLLFLIETLGLKDVAVLELSPAQIEAAWAVGEIDAAFIWDPVLSRLVSQG
eukprot:1209331-Prymnesium_polylepis.1